MSLLHQPNSQGKQLGICPTRSASDQQKRLSNGAVKSLAVRRFLPYLNAMHLSRADKQELGHVVPDYVIGVVNTDKRLQLKRAA